MNHKVWNLIIFVLFVCLFAVGKEAEKANVQIHKRRPIRGTSRVKSWKKSSEEVVSASWILTQFLSLGLMSIFLNKFSP